LLSAGLHAMDGLRWFMGGKIVEVTQYATEMRGPEFAEYEYAPTANSWWPPMAARSGSCQ
ncbi:MAG TPA: hypothetical protein VLL95_11955, partial [Phnomibacter sp.]|nr:hypothetical protein [Phnomibacter sp.]